MYEVKRRQGQLFLGCGTYTVSAEWIAASDYDALLAERDALAGGLKALQEYHDGYRDESLASIAALVGQLAQARAALEWYANPSNYISGRMGEGGHGYLHHIQWDAGDRARAALSARNALDELHQTDHEDSAGGQQT